MIDIVSASLDDHIAFSYSKHTKYCEISFHETNIFCKDIVFTDDTPTIALSPKFAKELISRLNEYLERGEK